MNDRIKSGSDPNHVAHVLAVREHLGVGEDVRVEDLSPLEWLRLQRDKAWADLRERDVTFTAAKEALDASWEHWRKANEIYVRAAEKERQKIQDELEGNDNADRD